MLNIMELQAIEDKFVCMVNCNIASGNEKENEEGKEFWEEKRKRSFYFCWTFLKKDKLNKEQQADIEAKENGSKKTDK